MMSYASLVGGKWKRVGRHAAMLGVWQALRGKRKRKKILGGRPVFFSLPHALVFRKVKPLFPILMSSKARDFDLILGNYPLLWKLALNFEFQ